MTTVGDYRTGPQLKSRKQFFRPLPPAPAPDEPILLSRFVRQRPSPYALKGSAKALFLKIPAPTVVPIIPNILWRYTRQRPSPSALLGKASWRPVWHPVPDPVASVWNRAYRAGPFLGGWIAWRRRLPPLLREPDVNTPGPPCPYRAAQPEASSVPLTRPPNEPVSPRGRQQEESPYVPGRQDECR